MRRAELEDIVRLRIFVGWMGESCRDPCWPNSFFSASSNAFLAPIFSKTVFLAKYHGVREAAALVHNRHIGVNAGVFHPFLLPESLERELHLLLCEEKFTEEMAPSLTNNSSAMAFLQTFSGKERTTKAAGPVRLGSSVDSLSMPAWQRVAQCYWQGFQTETRTFPYFSEDK